MYLRFLLLFLAFLQISFSMDYRILQKEYFFKNSEVYAKDLFPDLENNFFLFKIPSQSNQYQIKSSQIIANFENEGIALGAESPIITFKRKFDGETSSIENYILAEFLRAYKQNNIQIEKIALEQITPVNFSEDSIVSIDFHSKLLKRNEGSFDIVVQEKSNDRMRNRKIYFKYSIKAKLQAVQTIDAISGRQSVNYTNARLVWIPFERVGSALMKESDMGKVAVRSYTPKDIIVTKDRLIPKRVVKKGDKIIVSVIEDGVLLEFTLEAQKDAAIGDVIKARAIGSKKTYEVEILESGKGRLL